MIIHILQYSIYSMLPPAPLGIHQTVQSDCPYDDCIDKDAGPEPGEMSRSEGDERLKTEGCPGGRRTADGGRRTADGGRRTADGGRTVSE